MHLDIYKIIMERKYMLPPDKPCETRVGPQYQAQIPNIIASPFQRQKRSDNIIDNPTKKLHK